MKHVVVLFLTFFSTAGFCQNTNEMSILNANENWGKEIIKFPIDWAPKLALEGFEELRFAPFWSNPENDQFWSLAMAWKVDTTGKLTTKRIEDNFEAYFDGLMKPNHWATTFPKPTVIFIENLNKKETYSLIGKMKLFDGFHTGELITLHIKVEQHFCEEANKAIVIFRFSPKDFEHSIWDELHSISQKPTACN